MGYDEQVVIVSALVWSAALIVLIYMGMHKSLTSLKNQIKDIRADIRHWRDYTRAEVRRLDKDQSALALELSKQRWERKQRR